MFSQTRVYVQQVCAANFGDICSVVGGEATEELLVRSVQGRRRGRLSRALTNAHFLWQRFKENILICNIFWLFMYGFWVVFTYFCVP